MKRTLSLLLIALLLLCPLLTAQADGDGYISTDIPLFSEEETARLNARAFEIYAYRGVAVYFFYMESAEDLIAYAEQFAETDVPESDAVILGMNSSHYRFQIKGDTAKAAFPDSVCDAIWAKCDAVKGDPEGKIRTFFDSADEVLADYLSSLVTDGGEVLTDGGKPIVNDRAELLGDAEREVLGTRLKRLGTLNQCDIVILTVPALEDGKDAESTADDFFDYGGYGYGAIPDETGMTVDGDGILLLIALSEREYHFSTSGAAIDLFDDNTLETMGDNVQPLLSRGQYQDAFLRFADDCEAVMMGGEPDTPEPSPEPTPVPTPMPPMTNTKTGRLPVVDQAGLLKPEEVTALSKRLVEIGEQYRCDVLVVTANGLDGKTAEEYADDFFDYGGYGYNAVPDANGTTVNGDGVVLLVSIEDRDFAVSTSGYGITAFTDYGIQTKLEDAFLPYLKENRYYEAFNAYADECGWLLDTARKGKPYDVGYYLNGVAVAIAGIIGLLLAFIPVNSMKRQLTSVSQSRNADAYLVPNSFVLTMNRDVLVGTHTSRTVHVEPQRSSGGGGGFHGGSSTHTSSSGGTHGGHSGKF